MSSAVAEITRSRRHTLRWLGEVTKPRIALDCWEWNTRHGVLSARDSAEPGKWNGNRTIYMKHWQDLVSARRLGKHWAVLHPNLGSMAHRTEQIWLICGTQSAKTRSFLYASLGYDVDSFDYPKAIILPRRKDFKKVLDNRITPFFEETPALVRHFPDTPQRRREDITDEFWRLDSCTVYMLCGEVADDLRSSPVCFLVFDEFDLLPIDVEATDNAQGQGDPIELAIDRQKTFTFTKLAIGATTPTTISGHGWRRLCKGSHERLLVECPNCAAHNELDWRFLVLIPGHEAASYSDVKGHDLARWQCPQCKYLANSAEKDAMVFKAGQEDRWVPGVWNTSAEYPQGRWVPSCQFDDSHRIVAMPDVTNHIRSGQMNSLYSPFISISEFKSHEIEAKSTGNEAEWITHMNGWCGEPYIYVVMAPTTPETLAKNAGTVVYPKGEIPKSAQRIALICDQQGNSTDTCWFPYVVRAWGPHGESWLIDEGKVMNWAELDVLESKQYLIEGEMRTVDMAVMDGNNGTMSIQTQSWSAKAPERRMTLHGRRWPDWTVQQRVQGSKGEKRNKRLVTGSRSFNFHSNACKTELYGRMEGKPNARPWHVPGTGEISSEYMGSLTSEVQELQEIRLPSGKQLCLVWTPRMHQDQQGRLLPRSDNHWWDCEAMAIALEHIMKWQELEPLIEVQATHESDSEPGYLDTSMGDYMGNG